MSNDSLARRLGDRHLRGQVNTHFDGATQTSGVVRLNADAAVATTKGGQHTIWLLANLLARQFGVIREVEVVLPQVPMHPGVALYGEAADLVSTVVRTLALVAGDAVSITVSDKTTRAVDVTVSVGQSCRDINAFAHIGVLGDGWNVAVGDPLRIPLRTTGSTNPFGPYVAACLAAGEVFKRLRRLREDRGRYIGHLNLSLWDYCAYETWEQMPNGLWPERIVLPPFYLVGAGAVGQAVGAVLAAIGSLAGHVTIIDHDKIDDTNLNRYILAILDNIGAQKSDLLAGYLNRAGISTYAYPGKWPDYAFSGLHVQQSEKLQSFEAEYKYALMLSCVDKNSGRHAIQRFWPKYCIGGSTPNLALTVECYDMSSRYECLMCTNPEEPARPTLEDIAAELRQLHPEERRRRAEARGADITAIDAYLAEPRCGVLGEQELAKFDHQSEPNWSIGFVSVACGTIVAAQLLKHVLVGPNAFPTDVGNALRFSFLYPGPRWSRHGRRVDCACSSTGKEQYQLLWGSASENSS